MSSTDTQTTTDWTGQVLRLTVEGPAQGGEFVARHQGRVVFVRGGITGEVVEVEITDDPGRSFCRGEVRTVVTAAAARVDPACPAAAAGAGCCDWSHIDPAAARDFQSRILSEQLQRIGGIEIPVGGIPVLAPCGDEASTGWRTAVRWVTDEEGRPGTRRPRSHEVVTETCVQADPRLLEAVLAADVPARREVLAVLDDEDRVHVAIRKIVAPPAAAGGSARDRRRRSAARNRANRARAGRWESLTGDEPVVRRLGDTRWELPVDAFWQAHRSAPAHYSRLVEAAASEIQPVRVWDLYGGSGVLAAAARRGAPAAALTVVEAAGAALGAAENALGAAGVRLVNSPVERFLADTSVESVDAELRNADLVLLDPPRSGAGVEVMRALCDVGARRIVHLGCDAAAMSRDVGVLVGAGWRIEQLGGVAAFPGTHHVEGVAVLDAPDL